MNTKELTWMCNIALLCTIPLSFWIYALKSKVNVLKYELATWRQTAVLLQTKVNNQQLNNKEK